MGAAARRHDGPPVTFNVTPLAFDRSGALSYTKLSEKLFSQLEKSGSIAGKPIGPNGAIVYHRDQLEAVMGRLFATGANDIDDEFSHLG